MNLGAEAWLMLLALALYVFDAALLLESDEFVLVRTGASRWRAAFGAHGWKLGRREPLLPNLLTPWRALVRLRWNPEQGLDGARTPGGPRLPAVGALPRVAVTVLLALIFVALPACLFVYPLTAVTLAVVALIYASCIVVPLSLRPAWPALGLGRGAWWTLCIECIACPPFCVNAVRKACLKAATPRVTLADVADDAARHGELDVLKREIARRVQEQIDIAPEGSARQARLEQAARSVAVGDDA